MNLSESVICSKCLLELDYLTFSKYNKIILFESNLALCSGPIQNTHTNFCKIAKRSWSYLTTSRVIFVKGNAITSDINCFTAIKWRQAASYPFYLFSWFSSCFLLRSPPVSLPSLISLHTCSAPPPSHPVPSVRHRLSAPFPALLVPPLCFYTCTSPPR